MTYILKERPQAHFPNATEQFGERTPKYPDFNFNIRLGGTAMVGLVKSYQALLQDMIPGLLLPPAPDEALHVTILRLGSEKKEGITRDEFKDVAERLVPVLGKIVVPKLVMGKNVYLGKDGFVFDVDPREPLDEIQQAICDVAGKEFSPPVIRHGTGFYTAGEANQETLEKFEQRLRIAHPDPVDLEVSCVTALEQYTIEAADTTYYDGEVIKEIALAA